MLLEKKKKKKKKNRQIKSFNLNTLKHTREGKHWCITKDVTTFTLINGNCKVK